MLSSCGLVFIVFVGCLVFNVAVVGGVLVVMGILVASKQSLQIDWRFFRGAGCVTDD